MKIVYLYGIWSIFPLIPLSYSLQTTHICYSNVFKIYACDLLNKTTISLNIFYMFYLSIGCSLAMPMSNHTFVFLAYLRHLCVYRANSHSNSFWMNGWSGITRFIWIEYYRFNFFFVHSFWFIFLICSRICYFIYFFPFPMSQKLFYRIWVTDIGRLIHKYLITPFSFYCTHT